MPRAEDLPEELRSLTKRQAREIRSNSWDSDVALLTNHLKQIVGQGKKRPVWLYALAALAVLGDRRVCRQPIFRTAHACAGASGASRCARRSVAPARGRECRRARRSRLRPRPSLRRRSAAKPLATAQPPKAAPAPAPESRAAKPAPAPSRALRTPRTAEPALRHLRQRHRDHRQPAAIRARPNPCSPGSRAPNRPPPKAVPKHRRRNHANLPRRPPREAPQRRSRSVASLNLPNRPASARELKIGDSWTYRLREVRFDRNLASVTHEISGGDKGGIRETLRLGARGDTQRRLPLEPRIFEQPLDQGAMLFEFSPFMTAFSELQPGVTWSRIAGATSSDSINNWRISGKVTGRERVRVAAGSFDAIKAELEGQLDLSSPMPRDPQSETIVAYQTYTVWFAPEVGRAIKYERRTYNRVRRLLEHEQYQLVSYKLQ